MRSLTTQSESTCEICGEKYCNPYGSASDGDKVCFDDKCRSEASLRRWVAHAGTDRCLAQNGVPPIFHSARLSDFSQEVTKDIPTDIPPPGIMIYGAPSVGKSHLAAALMRNQMPKYANDKGVNANWTSTPMLLAEIRQAFKESSSSSELDLIKSYVKWDLLVMDDLGSEKPTEWALATLCTIINERLNELKTTIITSNLSTKKLNALDSRISNRIMSYLRIHFEGENRRKSQGRVITVKAAS
jgi:DNA replication protein DnaC